MFSFYSTGSPLAQQIAKLLSVTLSPISRHKFSDGNSFIQLQPLPAPNSTIFFLQTIAQNSANDDLVELLFTLDAAKRAGSQQNILVFPYFSYAKADKTDGAGTSLRAAVCTKLLEDAGATAAFFLDWHSDKLTDFFTIPATNLSPVPLFIDHLTQNPHFAPNNLIIVSPDAGYAGRARESARALSAPVAVGAKRRLANAEGIDSIALDGDFTGKSILIVDDFTTSGSTLLYLATLLHQRGAAQITICVTHCLLDRAAQQKFTTSPVDLFITTNSLPQPTADDRTIILDCATLLASAIKNY